MMKIVAASRPRDAYRMINIPCDLLYTDQTALSPFTERLGNAYRTLHRQTLPALRQLDRHIAEMLAHPSLLLLLVPPGKSSWSGTHPSAKCGSPRRLGLTDSCAVVRTTCPLSPV